MTCDYPERQGKYIRPTLLLLACEAMGTDQSKAMTTAAALQLSEDWILVHDDIEDGSKYRRGKRTLHELYTKPLAINAGDTLHLVMWRLLFDNYRNLGINLANRVSNEFYNMLIRTHIGQSIELFWQRSKDQMSETQIEFIMTGKAAYYTIAGPLRLGAIIAKANDSQIDQLLEFGRVLGLAFQIQDDILDVTSTFDGMKLQVGNDIYEGKATILLAHLLRTVSNGTRRDIIRVINKPRMRKSVKDVSHVISLMREYGSIDYATHRKVHFAKMAESLFSKIRFFTNKRAADGLAMAIRFLVDRSA